MLDEEKQPEKVYYTIGEVAEMFDLNVSNVRYWENEFDILMPKKNAKGDRFFTKKDVENIRIIKELIKERGYTIEGAKIKLRENRDELQERMKIVNSLENIKSFLTQMKLQLDQTGEKSKPNSNSPGENVLQQTVITFIDPANPE